MSSSLRNQALRGAALMSSRQVLVGVVTLGGIIALPLLLSPAEFSLYGYANTTLLASAALGDLGLGAYLIKNQIDDRDISGSFALQLAFWIPVCLILMALGLLTSPFGFTNLTLILLVLAFLFLSLQTLPTALLEKEMAFKQISILEIVQRVLFVGIAVALAIFHPSQWSIPLAVAVAAIAGYPAFLVVARWRWRPRFNRDEPLFSGFSSQWWQVRIANQAAYATFPLLGGILFTAHEVGLIVWSLAITSLATYLAPMIARATFPAMTRATVQERVQIYSGLFRALLLIGMPLVAVLLATADPLTRIIFGENWTDGINLLRLQSISAIIGLYLTPLIPLLFLSYSPHGIKWISVITTLAVIVLSVALAPAFSFLSITIATIVCQAVASLTFDRILHRHTGYSPLRDMTPALFGVAVAATLGYGLTTVSGGFVMLLLAALVAGCLQIGVTYLLGGGINPRRALDLLRGSGSQQGEVRPQL